jgi:LmbE family N-acetylglucosaminyl deacetylase
VAAIRRVRPDVVLCPDPTAVFFGDSYYNHADHRMAGWVTLDAVSPAARNPHYFPGTGPAHAVAEVYLSATFEPNVWVDVSESLDTKIDAVLCHRSQLAGSGDWFASVLRQRAADDGEAVGVPYAESFRRLLLSS